MSIHQQETTFTAEPEISVQTPLKRRKRMSKADVANKLWQMNSERLNSVSAFLVGNEDAARHIPVALRSSLAELREDPLRARMIAAFLRELGGNESREELHSDDAAMLKRELTRELERVA